MSRVLRRAQELQDERSPIDDTRVSAGALVDAAAEVGIDPDAVRDSLAIERLEVVDPDVGALDRLAGPTWVVVERRLDMSREAALEAVEVWLSTGHRRRCARRDDGALVAMRRSDTSARARRVVAGLRGDAILGRARLVVADAASLTGGDGRSQRCLVRIGADRGAARGARLSGGVSIGAAGLVGALAAGAQVAVAAAPAVAVPLLAGGYLVARSGRHHANHVALELDRLLSAVARGERPSGFIARSVRRVAGPTR